MVLFAKGTSVCSEPAHGFRGRDGQWLNGLASQDGEQVWLTIMSARTRARDQLVAEFRAYRPQRTLSVVHRWNLVSGRRDCSRKVLRA